MKNDSRRGVTVRFGESPDLPALYGAAHLLSRYAYVRLDTDGKSYSVTLTPKSGQGGLTRFKAEFAAAYADQKFRWELARLNMGVRAQILDAALRGPEAGADPGPAPRLGPAQAAEIEALVRESEAEAEPDPEGIRRTWSDLRKRPS